MTVDQTTFSTALLDPEVPRPIGLLDGQGAPAGRRFDVYRNNVATSLTEALETAFPTLRKLLGEANFKILAGVFLRKHPPSSPVMMFYGEEMPQFLADFGPTSDTGYLPDIARLELCLRHSYHASDANPIDPTDLQSLPPDQLMEARFDFAPSCILLQSDWPVYAIWLFNNQDGAPKPEMASQDVLIARTEFDPDIHLLGTGAGAFVRALMDGDKFGASLEIISTDTFDLSSTLALLLGAGAIIKIGD